MIGYAINAEWIKLRTVRSHIVLAIIAVAFPLLLLLLTLLLTDDAIDVELVTGLTTGSGILSSLLIGVLGALSYSQENAHGTVRVSLTAVPSRVTYLVSKTIVVVATAASLALLILGVNTLVGSVVATARDGEGGLQLGPAVAFVGLAMLFSLFGLALGLLVRNAALAIVALVVWSFIAEGLIGALLTLIFDDALSWMPVSAALQAVIPGDVSSGPGRAGGIGLFAAFVSVLMAGGTTVMLARDA